MKKQRNIYHPPIRDLQCTSLSCAGTEAGACPSSNWATAGVHAGQSSPHTPEKFAVNQLIVNWEENWKAYKLTIWPNLHVCTEFDLTLHRFPHTEGDCAAGFIVQFTQTISWNLELIPEGKSMKSDNSSAPGVSYTHRCSWQVNKNHFQRNKDKGTFLNKFNNWLCIVKSPWQLVFPYQVFHAKAGSSRVDASSFFFF